MLELDWIEEFLREEKMGHRSMKDLTLKQRHAIFVFKSGRRGVKVPRFRGAPIATIAERQDEESS